MTLIQQPIEVTTSPAKPQADVGVESSRDRVNRRKGCATRMATLQPRDRGLGDAGTSCEVRLAPAQAPSQSADRPSQPEGVHIRGWCRQLVICRVRDSRWPLRQASSEHAEDDDSARPRDRLGARPCPAAGAAPPRGADDAGPFGGCRQPDGRPPRPGDERRRAPGGRPHRRPAPGRRPRCALDQPVAREDLGLPTNTPPAHRRRPGRVRRRIAEPRAVAHAGVASLLQDDGG